MDTTESVTNYVLLVEYMVTDDTTLEDILMKSFPASNFDRDWTVVINMQIEEEQEVEDVPVEGKTVTVRPSQAIVYLGEDHAGIIGAGAGEFYDDRFDVEDDDLKGEFINDFKCEVIE